MKVRYPFLVEDKDRHGNVRVYFRRDGRKVRIRETPGSPEFSTVYAALVAGAAPVRRDATGTLGWLADRYMLSSVFRALDVTTQATRRRVIAHMLAEPVRPGAAETFRDFPLPRLTLPALEVLRDRKRDKPGTASDRVKALRALFLWAADAQRRRETGVMVNPALLLTKPRMAGEGHHSWSDDEIARFEARHPLGTKAHLALQLILYTGARRSDAHRLGRQHLRAVSEMRNGQRGRVDWLEWTAFKGRNRYPVQIAIPVLAPLAAAIAASPTGDLVFLVTEQGKPFTRAGFGNWFGERCREAGLPHCSAHGLRKAAARCAAENGASTHMLREMFGWKTLAEAERYTRAAERKRLAAAGAALISFDRPTTPETVGQRRDKS